MASFVLVKALKMCCNGPELAPIIGRGRHCRFDQWQT